MRKKMLSIRCWVRDKKGEINCYKLRLGSSIYYSLLSVETVLEKYEPSASTHSNWLSTPSNKSGKLEKLVTTSMYCTWLTLVFRGITTSLIENVGVMVSRFFEFKHAKHVEAIVVFTNANVDIVASPPIVISISQCGTKGIKYHILCQINMSKN